MTGLFSLGAFIALLCVFGSMQGDGRFLWPSIAMFAILLAATIASRALFGDDD